MPRPAEDNTFTDLVAVITGSIRPPRKCQSCDSNGAVLAAGRDPEPCTECDSTGRMPGR